MRELEVKERERESELRPRVSMSKKANGIFPRLVLPPESIGSLSVESEPGRLLVLEKTLV